MTTSPTGDEADESGYCATCHAPLKGVMSSCEVNCPRCGRTIETGDDWIAEATMAQMRAAEEQAYREWVALNQPSPTPETR